MKILVTGAAGFIGFHLVNRLLDQGHEVVGVDNLNTYYSVDLKLSRLKECGIDVDRIAQCQPVVSSLNSNYKFVLLDIVNKEDLERLWSAERFDVSVNLAAQAGVRYSLENPYSYIQSNVMGFLNLLECARHYPVKHFVYASSSSVYGGNTKTPFSEEDRVDNPVSLYAATKKSDELMAHVYSHLYGIPTTGLRFFTVYGPWGRPDMAPILFANAISSGNPIKVFNHGDLSRDFTYIDDIIEGVVRVVEKPAAESACKVYNIGCGEPVQLMDFIREIEGAFGVKAELNYLPMQPGDVSTTYADTTLLARDFGYKPKTHLADGIREFVKWYKSYYSSK